MNKTIYFWCAILCMACSGPGPADRSKKRDIDENMFQHQYITQDLPGDTDWGYGCPALADFDKYGDLDGDDTLLIYF